MALIKKLYLILLILVLFTMTSGCSIQKKYENLKNGELLLAGRDTFYYRINSKLALSDNVGTGTDHIKWIPEDMETAEDSIDYGTDCYSAIIDRVYCGDDLVVIELLKYNQYIVINCNEPQSKCISTYNSIENIEFNYKSYPVIDCLYPEDLR